MAFDMAMKRFALLVTLLLVACGSSSWARPVGIGENGRKRFLVTCKRDIGLCYERAGTVCHGHFFVVDPKLPMTLPQGSGAIFVDCK